MEKNMHLTIETKGEHREVRSYYDAERTLLVDVQRIPLAPECVTRDFFRYLDGVRA